MIESESRPRERRRFPRVAIEFGVRMIDVFQKPMEASPSGTPCYETHFVATNAVGKNISEGGFAFETSRKPSVCSVLGLEFALPMPEEDCGSALHPSSHCGAGGFRGLGQVVWTAPLEEKYVVGVRFIDLNPRRSAALRRLVVAHNFIPSRPVFEHTSEL